MTTQTGTVKWFNEAKGWLHRARRRRRRPLRPLRDIRAPASRRWENQRVQFKKSSKARGACRPPTSAQLCCSLNLAPFGPANFRTPGFVRGLFILLRRVTP